jgi:hypothetical protein
VDIGAGTLSAPKDAWERLGRLLARRRVELDPAYRSRQKFVEATGLNERLVADLENARRTSYRDTTVYAVENAYKVVSGSLTRALEGGPLAPQPEQTGDPQGMPGFAIPPDLEMPPGIDLSSLPPVERHLWVAPAPLEVRRMLVDLAKMARKVNPAGFARWEERGDASGRDHLTAN